MKTLRSVPFFGIISFLVTIPFSLPAAAAQTYKIDPVHSSVIFRIKHLDITYVYGRFNTPSGTLQFDRNDENNNAIEMKVEAVNVDTDNSKRDKHLQSEDFFHVIQYPYISFKSNSFKEIEPDVYEVSGDLTLHGVTKPLTVTARHTGSGEDPWGGQRIGFESTFPVTRSDFGVAGSPDSVADAVQITVSIEAIRQ
mgnify:CR=1 FL=1